MKNIKKRYEELQSENRILRIRLFKLKKLAREIDKELIELNALIKNITNPEIDKEAHSFYEER